jgi:hypothetical protein
MAGISFTTSGQPREADALEFPAQVGERCWVDIRPLRAQGAFNAGPGGLHGLRVECGKAVGEQQREQGLCRRHAFG